MEIIGSTGNFNIESKYDYLVGEMYSLAFDGSIKTRSGSINIFDPKQEDIIIEDIAFALSFHVTRWLQAGNRFYPVAKHCIDACNEAPKELKLQALLHDASEAYMWDMPSPIKRMLPDYKEAENRLMMRISEKFRFNYPLDDEIKAIDKQLLEYEWVYYVNKDSIHLEDSRYYYDRFLKLYYEYAN